MAVLYLADTNILIRLLKQDHREYPLVRGAVGSLGACGIGLAYTFQNMTEFWNASTRPLSRNGFALSIEDAARDTLEIERNFSRLIDNEAVYSEWRRLVVLHRVSGVQVHDARLAASMLAHGLTHILTFNTADFVRFDGIRAVHPEELQATHPDILKA